MLMLIVNLMQSLRDKKIPFLPRLIQKFIRLIFAFEIPHTVIVGKNTKFIHNGLGTVIHNKSVIGNNVRIYQNVTIGGRHDRGCPRIENDVFIGAGACVLGGVVIGKGAVIGANAVVIDDVEPNSVVGGIPAKVIKRGDENR